MAISFEFVEAEPAVETAIVAGAFFQRLPPPPPRPPGAPRLRRPRRPYVRRRAVRHRRGIHIKLPPPPPAPPRL